MRLPYLKKILSVDVIINSLKSILIIVVILISVAGCKQKNIGLNISTHTFSMFPSEDTINFTDISEFTSGVGAKLELVDSTLIIYDGGPGKSFLHNYSLKTGQFSEGYVHKGRGPGEAIGVKSLGVIGEKVWLYDITMRKVLVSDVKNVLSNSVEKSFNHYSIENHYYMIGFKDNSHLYCVGSPDSDFKIQEVDLTSGKEIGEYCKIQKIPEDLSLRQYKKAYETFIVIKPTGDKIVLPYRHTDLIEIYDVKTQKSFAVYGPERFEVIYQKFGETIATTDETRYAFVAWSVTDNYIYLVYSGLKESEEYAYYGNSIFIYDWNGNPVRKLVSDRIIDGFVVSDDDKVMYAYDINSGYLIEAKL